MAERSSAGSLRITALAATTKMKMNADSMSTHSEGTSDMMFSWVPPARSRPISRDISRQPKGLLLAMTAMVMPSYP